eukprot:6967331-Prymnesium_polylepis.1
MPSAPAPSPRAHPAASRARPSVHDRSGQCNPRTSDLIPQTLTSQTLQCSQSPRCPELHRAGGPTSQLSPRALSRRGLTTTTSHSSQGNHRPGCQCRCPNPHSR